MNPCRTYKEKLIPSPDLRFHLIDFAPHDRRIISDHCFHLEIICLGTFSPDPSLAELRILLASHPQDLIGAQVDESAA
jgi:hypothetical protein